MYRAKFISLSVLSSLLAGNLFAAENPNNPYIYNNYYQQKPVKKKIIKRKKRVRKVDTAPTEKLIVENNRPKPESNYHVFLNALGKYYAGIEFGQTNLSRSVTLNSATTGETLYRSDNGQEIGPADGTTYTFNQGLQYNRLAIVGGFQERNTGDFYQVSYYTNDLVQDLLLTLGYSYKKFGYQYMYGSIPFLKIDAGVGHTGTTNGMPTNYSLGLGVGAYKNIENYQLKAAFAYQKRNWFYLDKDIGKEKWEDSETTFYIGASYFF
jgi:hypothetical protein